MAAKQALADLLARNGGEAAPNVEAAVASLADARIETPGPTGLPGKAFGALDEFRPVPGRKKSSIYARLSIAPLKLSSQLVAPSGLI